MIKGFDDVRPEELVERNKRSDTGYVPLKLASSGKLGLPALIYVRDYTYTDALHLSTMTTDNASEIVFDVISNIIKDGNNLPLQNLTYTDVLEILMTVQGTWYSPTVEYPYYINETLPKGEIDKKENISKASIKISSIEVTPFPENVKVPATVKTKDGFEAEVDYPRFYNEVIAKQYIEEKYAEKDNRYASLKKKVKDGTYTSSEFRDYTSYESEKATDLIKALQALQILSVNGKALNSMEDRFNALDDFPLKAWTAVMNHLNSIRFGVEESVTFNCTVTGKEITRRFPFRIFDFLPTVESSGNAGNDVLIC